MITSLWKVDDQATSQLFTRFYHYLWKEKMSPDKALRQVKLDMIHSRLGPARPGEDRASDRKPKKKPINYASPYYWGSFVYYGGKP